MRFVKKLLGGPQVGQPSKRYTPRTRIVATLGPASSSETVLRAMFRSGLDIVRLNFSHGNKAGHAARVDAVRTLNRKMRRRIRIGDPQRIPFDYESDLEDLVGASHAFLDDGSIVLAIRRITSRGVETRVEVGGTLRERKAINFPGADLHFPALSTKDARDIDFAVEQGLDVLAISFVRSAADVLAVRTYLGGRLPKCRLIAKIENQEGIDNIDTILDAADGMMVARGDMGVCVPIYKVPLIQKDLLKRCRAAGKLSITATQMLESMVENRSPTRAEVCDVANAVLDGTDCVMLSAETAVGRYPGETVSMMNHIIKYTEQAGNGLE